MFLRHFCVLLLLFISLFNSISTAGQMRGRSRNAQKPVTGDPTSSVITRSDVPAKRNFNHHEKIEWRYDNIRDITVVNLDKMWVGPHFQLSAYFGCYGQGCDASTPSFVRIFLTTSSSARWRLGKIPTMIIRAGRHQKRIRPEYEREIQPTKFVGGLSYGPYYAEYLKFDFSTKEFLNTVNSERVSMQIARENVRFSKENLEALRDLASRLPIRQ